MPREFLHWSILESVKESHTDADRTLYGTLWPYAYWGALFQDAGYFLTGRDAASGEAVADTLHGTKAEDTFTVLRRLGQGISSLEDSAREPAALFLWGALSHAHVDIVFHPWVVYVTGNYYDPEFQAQERARSSHRLLETYLDWWVMENAQRPKVVLLSEVYKGSKCKWEPLISWIAQSTERDPKWWQKAFSKHSQIQSYFHSDIWGAFVRFLASVSPRKFGSRDALFAYKRTNPLPFFGREFSFKHPISGDVCTTNFRNLYQMSARRTQQSWSQVSEALRSGNWDEFLRGQDGASLDLGLPHVKSSEAKYFSEVPFKALIRE